MRIDALPLPSLDRRFAQLVPPTLTWKRVRVMKVLIAHMEGACRGCPGSHAMEGPRHSIVAAGGEKFSRDDTLAVSSDGAHQAVGLAHVRRQLDVTARVLAVRIAVPAH